MAMPFMDVNLSASDSYYAFSSPSNRNSPTLVIDRPSGDLRLTDTKPSGAKRISSISGILGIIKLRLDRYVIVINKSQAVGKVKGQTIYRVTGTELLPLRERPLHDADEDTYLSLLRQVLKTGPMYFSYGQDLTNSFQRQAKQDQTLPMWMRADDRFFWNKFISSDLIDFRTGGGNAAGYRVSSGSQPGIDPYILPVICGMLEVKRTAIKGAGLTFMLVTRRSRHRIGTRYFSRGLDENGNVSNFNETEQIVVLNDPESQAAGAFGSSDGGIKGGASRDVHVLAYVQTRGSVPVFWAEVNKLRYTPDLQIRGVDSAVAAAKKHFDQQIQLYGDNYLVNLVNQKGREKRVKDAYEQMVRSLQTAPPAGAEKANPQKTVQIVESASIQQEFDRLHYVYFDFHNETKGLKWHRTQLLLDELAEPLNRQRYFHGVYNLSDRSRAVEIRNAQRSVVRTNCMDCLDRTNVVQSMLGRLALARQLTDLLVLRAGETAADDAAFEHLFRNVWADNADVVSRSYSGTGALKTDFTRTGNRTKAGALQDLSNSITRYVRNNFRDGPRQDAFDLFSGAYLPERTSAAGPLFADRRPLPVQSVPYVLSASIFFITIATATTRLPDASIWPLRFLEIIFVAVAAYCAHFMWMHGPLYVNWPKLNTPSFATESVSEALSTAIRKDPIIGRVVAGHDRGRSDGRAGYMMEEGKKRVE